MKPMTQAELSQATSKARQWFERNRRRYAPDDVRLFDRLIPLVEKPPHLHALSEELERRMLAKTQDSAANPPAHRTPRHSPAPSPSTQPTEATK